MKEVKTTGLEPAMNYDPYLPVSRRPIGTLRRPVRNATVVWLLDLLKDGPVSAKEVKRLAKEAGIGPRVLRDASYELMVTKSPKGLFSGPWYWTILLPKSGG